MLGLLGLASGDCSGLSLLCLPSWLLDMAVAPGTRRDSQKAIPVILVPGLPL